jgi:hypothetical protein
LEPDAALYLLAGLILAWKAVRWWRKGSVRPYYGREWL